MKKNKNSINKVSLVVIVVTILLGMLEYTLIDDYKNNIDNHNNKIIEHYEEQYKTIINGYRLLSKTYFDEIINNKNVLDIIEAANYVNKERKSVLREELNDILKDTYLNMINNNFRQFHFVLKDNTSFLRMHKIEKFGDDLKTVRNTVRLANDEKRYVEGFEEGRISNGYRFEYPLFKHNEHIGCVETSISFLSVIKLMDQQFKNPTTFMIKKSVVQDKVWEEQIKKNYEESRISNLYYYDKEGYEYISNNENHTNVIKTTLNNKEEIKEMVSLLKQEKTFIIHTSNKNHTYSIVFLNIKNVIGENVGYLVFYNEDSVYHSYGKSIIINSIFILVLWVCILVSIFLYYRSKEQMYKMTYYDKLTNVYNRNKLYEYIQNEIERNKRYDTDFSIIMFDIDYFKRINDNYGHITGDSVLKEISDLVKNNIRIIDSLFRFGGDEFIILLPNTKLDNAEKVAEKIRVGIINKKYFAEVVENITLSLGVTQYKNDQTSEQLIKRADDMLYKAKEKGRNKVYGDR